MKPERRSLRFPSSTNIVQPIKNIPRSQKFEGFKYLHVGMISELKRKSLPAIAKVGLSNPQPLHHFLAHSPWKVEAVKDVRLQLLLSALKDQEFILCIDETGDRKKEKQIMWRGNILVT